MKMELEKALRDTIINLLPEFEGKGDTYYWWKQQLTLITDLYALNDQEQRALVALKLRGMAKEWFLSNSHHSHLSTPQLLQGLQSRFDYTNRDAMRKKLESRVWKSTETFGEYAADKEIMFNRLSISEPTVIEYLINGIPDLNLQTQARLFKFKTVDDMSKAFQGIVLPKSTVPREVCGSSGCPSSSRIRGEQTRCYNCGGLNHMVIWFRKNCLMKKNDIKGCKCDKQKHIASSASCESNNNEEQLRRCTGTTLKIIIR